MKSIVTTYISHARQLLRTSAISGSGMLEPKRDWYLILICACVLALGFAGMGVYVYHVGVRLPQGGDTPEQVERQVPDVERLAHVIGAYRERAMEFERLRGVQSMVQTQAVTPIVPATTTPTATESEDEATSPDAPESVELRS